MTRSQRLHRVASQTQREQSAISKRLAELIVSLGREEAQLKALRGHLADYRGSLADMQQDGALAVKLKNHARFTERLHLAVREQEQRVELAHQAYERQLAAWKEQRVHDIGVGGERDPALGLLENRRVPEPVEHRIPEPRQQQPLDELMGHPAAAPVGDLHGVVVSLRQRAGEAFLHDHPSSRTLPRP